MSKVINLAKPGDEGIHCSLHVDNLHVDHTYQRGEVSRHTLAAITKDFKWSAFGELIIAERPDGKKFVIDGQQRLAAAKSRGINFVPCLVFKSGGVAEEANSFISANINRTPVPSIYKFNAAVMAGNQPELSIKQWLDSVNLSTGDHAGNRTIDFVVNLIVTWKAGVQSCKNAIILQNTINKEDDTFNCLVHKGMWTLYMRGIPLHEYAKKIIESGGKTEILRSIKQTQIEAGYKSSNYSMCARGLVRIINRGKRTRRIIVQLNDAFGEAK